MKLILISVKLDYKYNINIVQMEISCKWRYCTNANLMQWKSRANGDIVQMQILCNGNLMQWKSYAMEILCNGNIIQWKSHVNGNLMQMEISCKWKSHVSGNVM